MDGALGMVSPEVIRTWNGGLGVPYMENKYVWAAGGALLGALGCWALSR